jgi:hypothetical protein
MSTAEQLRTCSAGLDHACDRLAEPSPESLGLCSTILESAIEHLSALQPTLNHGDAEALAEAWRLRRTVRRAGLLLTSAADYHRRWQERLGIQTAGYGPDGRAGNSAVSGRLCVRA